MGTHIKSKNSVLFYNLTMKKIIKIFKSIKINDVIIYLILLIIFFNWNAIEEIIKSIYK